MLEYQIAFSQLKGMNLELANQILSTIPSERDFLTLPQSELEQILGVQNRIFDDKYRRELLEKSKRELDALTKYEIQATYFTDKEYPSRFFSAYDAPILYYTRGNCNLNRAKAISIVGTRNATTYGKNFCNTLVKELHEQLDDIIIVSGLAYGIDIAAHNAALQYNLPTVAVLAQGLNSVYPAAHRNYANNIIRSGGALLSDYTTQDSVHRANFLARNRIIAALADCVIVVESSSKGGAITTAKLAQSYNRDCFALSGRYNDEFSIGCNNLIRNNYATLFNSADDLIDSMRWEKSETIQPKQTELFPELTTDESAILTLFPSAGDSIHINKLCELSSSTISQLLTTLMELEFKGLIQSLAGGKYLKL
ncbi:MAG: DNA-processing protein DprA [Bacteroidales bacterium]